MKRHQDSQWKMLITLSSAYIASSLSMQGFLALMPYIKEEFFLSRTQAGLYSAFFFLTATLTAIFSGRIVDLIGSKKGIVFGATVVGGLYVLHALAPGYYLILILALLGGIGFSIITPSLNKAVMREIEPARRAFSMGVVQSGSGIGGFIGASLLPVVGAVTGWRIAIFIAGILAVALGIYIARFYQEDNGHNNGKEREGMLSFTGSVKVLLKNKELLLVCLVGLAFGTSVGGIPAHYALYLNQDLSFSRSIAGFALGLFHVGGIVGRPAWGWISDHLLRGSRRQALILAGFFMSATAIIYSLYVSGFVSTVLVIYIFSFILGITGLGWMGLFFTTVAELAGEEHTGIATGLALVFVRSGIVSSPPVFGYIADLTESYRYSWLTMGLVILLFTTGFMVFSRKYKAEGFNNDRE